MRCKYRIVAMAVAVLAMTATAAFSAAQQDPGRKNPANQQDPTKKTVRDQRPAVDRERPREGRAIAGADKFFVSCLKIETENEIALSKFAQQRAQSEEVKKFAQQMIQDHEAILEKLRGFAPTEPSSQPSPAVDAAAQSADRPLRRNELREGAQQREDAVTERTTRPGPGGPGGAGVDMMQLHKELAQQCLATLTAELERKKGPEFDRCYMGQQLFAHLAMWDALKVFGKHASPDLQRTLAAGQDQTEQHLQEARRILKDLEANAPRTASRPAAKEAE